MNPKMVLDSLQAKIIARLSESGRLPCKAFFLTHFDRSSHLSRLQYGARLIFSLEARRIWESKTEARQATCQLSTTLLPPSRPTLVPRQRP